MWLEMSVETFVFIFGAWSSVSPKGMDSSEEGWLGWEERHVLTQHGLQ